MPLKKAVDRDTFSGVNIDYIGGIENLEVGESITGSCTLFSAQDTQGKKISIVIDCGSHQSGKKSQELNNTIDPRLIDADYIIITHAHIDHIGRLPMLIKEGFQGKIYMTNYTKSLGQHSLLDSASLMQNEYDGVMRMNAKKRKMYQDALRYLNAQSKIQVNNLKVGEKDKLKKCIAKIEEEYGDALKSILSNIVEYDISSNEKVEDILKPVPIPLFTQEDVIRLFSGEFIQILEPGSFTHLTLSSHRGAKDIKDKPTIEEIRLSFTDAAHIIGSVQAEISVRTRQILPDTQKINGDSDTRKDHNFLFSGDLGRTDAGNFAGNLEMPKGDFKYAQVESTYADRNHPERENSVKELFDVLLNAKQKVVIPAFSIQRTQDILLLLLRYYEEIVIPQREELKKGAAQLKKDFKDSEQTDEEREIYEHVLGGYNEEFEKLEFEVFCDSKLGNTATNIFAQAFGGEYSALTEDNQKSKYGEVFINFVTNDQTHALPQEFYDQKTFEKIDKKDVKHKKQIYVSSGGMCEGGPIIPHLMRNISNANSTIIFMGYTPPTSLGGRIKSDDTVLIEGKAHRVHADVHDITGFSGHAGEDTLLEYTSQFKNDTIIALTHGGNARYKMKEKMKKPRRGKINCPQNGDTLQLPF